MIKLKQLITEKTLYHGTLIDNASDIEQFGLIPSVGEFVKNAYDMSGYSDEGEEIDPDDYLQDLVFATDKEQLDKAVTAITAQIAHKFNKGFHDVTSQEFIRNGALVIIKDGDSAMTHRNSDQDETHPHTVEPGDYYSENHIPVDYVLTGNKMIAILKRYGVWPRNYQFADVDVNDKMDVLIKAAIRRNPTRTKEEILKIIKTWDNKTIDSYYNKIQSQRPR